MSELEINYKPKPVEPDPIEDIKISSFFGPCTQLKISSDSGTIIFQNIENPEVSHLKIFRSNWRLKPRDAIRLAEAIIALAKQTYKK